MTIAPDIRAVMVQARLEIRVLYPPELLSKIEKDNELIQTAMSAAPEWARAFGAPHLDLNPSIHGWIGNLSSQSIRDEFSRKAKKIGLSLPNTDLQISYDLKGITVSLNAKGRV